MKNLLATLLAVAVLSVSAFSQTTSTTTTSQAPTQKGQVTAQSVDYTVTSTNVNLLYLRDGFDNYTALSVPFFTFPNTSGRLTAVALGAVDMNNLSHKLYAGTGLDYHVPIKGGYSLDFIGGLKGFDLTNLGGNGQVAGLSTGKGSWVFGFGFSFPIK